jgi:hypothetical protein
VRRLARKKKARIPGGMRAGFLVNTDRLLTACHEGVAAPVGSPPRRAGMNRSLGLSRALAFRQANYPQPDRFNSLGVVLPLRVFHTSG